MRIRLIAFLFLLALPLWTKAGGYQVNLVGVRYIGMGHIGTALSLDAGTIFFNPGNMGFLENKYSFTGSISGVFSYNTFQAFGSDYTAKTDNPVAPPFSVFGAVKITDKLSAGLGVYTPFGSTVKWDPNWSGKYLVRDISLTTILVQPTVSYKINDMLSIGAGAVFAYGKVELNRALPVGSASAPTGNVQLKGNTTNWGFNAGLGFKPTEDLTIGFSYRSKINMNVKNGDAIFTVPASLATNFPAANKFDASIPLPANWNFGLAYQFSDKLLIGADFNFVQWNAYDTLAFDFEQNTSSLQDSRDPKEYENSFIIRLGGQYKLSDKLHIRAGGYYDNSPVRGNLHSPETPDADRLGLSAGLSFFPMERLSIDASFLYVNEFKRDASYDPENFGGTYKSVAYVPGIGLSYSF